MNSFPQLVHGALFEHLGYVDDLPGMNCQVHCDSEDLIEDRWVVIRLCRRVQESLALKRLERSLGLADCLIKAGAELSFGNRAALGKLGRAISGEGETSNG